MKALSIRQPWAEAILNCGKRIENREWRACHYRGPLLIHAAKGMTQDEYNEAEMWIRLEFGLHLPAREKLDRGGVVGACDLVAVLGRDGKPTSSEDRDRMRHVPMLDTRWYSGPVGLVLADVKPLPFMPYKGALGFFDVPGATPDLVVEIARREGRCAP